MTGRTYLERRFAALRLNLGIIPVFILVVGTGVAEAATPAGSSNPGSRASLSTSSDFPGAPTLDSKHLWALGMIETGNNDWEVGGEGEVSRYQIHPAVWKAYSSSHDYENPVISVKVARAHWNYLAEYFKEHAGRNPTDFDMYVMWNTNYGYYAHKGFNPKRLASVVQDRAQRFVNLVNRRDFASR